MMTSLPWLHRKQSQETLQGLVPIFYPTASLGFRKAWGPCSFPPWRNIVRDHPIRFWLVEENTLMMEAKMADSSADGWPSFLGDPMPALDPNFNNHRGINEAMIGDFDGENFCFVLREINACNSHFILPFLKRWFKLCVNSVFFVYAREKSICCILDDLYIMFLAYTKDCVESIPLRIFLSLYMLDTLQLEHVTVCIERAY